jgi:Tfp pilus assembly protein PilF
MRRISAGEFVRRLKVVAGEADKRYALFLGAGCSVSSGIPAAAELVAQDWIVRLHKLCLPDQADPLQWATSAIPGFDARFPSRAYGSVIERLFFHPEERQREIERLCDGKFPGFAYAVLAQLITLSDGRFNVVLTTNFDDLVADALYLFTSARPLVIQHEFLATYIRPTRTRPLVVKLHGDHRLAPHNTAQETASLKKDIETRVSALLHDRGIIFIGYGGNDHGIASMLESLPNEAVPYGVYWVSASEPESEVRKWLDQKDAVWVEKGDFDEFMLLVHDTFGLEHPQPSRFADVFSEYQRTYERLSAAINALPDSTPGVSQLKDAAQRADESLEGWTSVAARARKLEKVDPQSASETYLKGIADFPDSAELLHRYANFLNSEGNADAIVYYERALALKPDSSSLLSDLGQALAHTDPDRAEDFHKRATASDPDSVFAVCRFAEFLASARHNYSLAAQLFEQAIANNASDPYPYSRYGHVARQAGHYSKAEELYREALNIDPNDRYTNGFLADLLLLQERVDEAEDHFRYMMEIGVYDAYSLTRYGDLLQRFRQKPEEARLLYEQALQMEPDYKHAALRLGELTSGIVASQQRP